MKRTHQISVCRVLPALLLALCMAVSSVGCIKLPEPTSDDTLHLVSNSGVSVFRVVYPQDGCSEEILQGALRVQTAMQHLLKVEVDALSDRGAADAPDLVLPYEILIGKTARRETLRVLDTLGEDEWAVRLVGNKLVAVGQSNRATEQAIEHLITQLLGYTDQTTPSDPTMGIPSDYAYQSRYEVPLIENNEIHSTMPRATYRAALVYPVSTTQSKADLLSIATLQGLAAAGMGEQIVFRDEAYEQYKGLLEGARIVEYNDGGEQWTLATLLVHYAKYLDGYILCDGTLTEQSAGVAVSLSHHLNAVVVTPENEQAALDAGLDCVLDVRGKTDEWLRQSKYFALLDTSVAVEQSADNAPSLIDYAVMSGCYCYFYDGTDAYAHAQRFKFLDDGARILLGSDAGESDMRQSLADINMQPIDAGQVCNLSTMSGFTCAGALGGNDDAEQKQNVHTVCFVVSNGGDMSWSTGDFLTEGSWYGSPLRGDFDVSWSVSATLCELASPVLNCLSAGATDADDFVLALTALGYTYSADWQNDARVALAQRVAKTMQCVGTSHLLVPSDMGADAQMLSCFAEQAEVEGIVYAGIFADAWTAGELRWMGGKPVVSMRYRLTGSAVDGTVEAIVQGLNAGATDTASADAYSVVVVDAGVGLDADGDLVDGGDTMAALAAIVAGLGEQVEVVTVSEFMARVNTNLK